MSAKIVAIVGSYRENGITERAVEAILEGARAEGAETRTVLLRQEHIEFCTNCRACAQNPGEARGRCSQLDHLEGILTEVEAADAVILASPVNYYNVTALFRRFLERLLGYTYWPWGHSAPKLRSHETPRRAVLVASAALPGFLIPFATGAPRALRTAAKMLGARTVGKLWIGLIAGEPQAPLPGWARQRAVQLGHRLAAEEPFLPLLTP